MKFDTNSKIPWIALFRNSDTSYQMITSVKGIIRIVLRTDTLKLIILLSFLMKAYANFRSYCRTLEYVRLPSELAKETVQAFQLLQNSSELKIILLNGFPMILEVLQTGRFLITPNSYVVPLVYTP